MMNHLRQMILSWWNPERKEEKKEKILSFLLIVRGKNKIRKVLTWSNAKRGGLSRLLLPKYPNQVKNDITRFDLEL
jgi:hypothetical protein